MSKSIEQLSGLPKSLYRYLKSHKPFVLEISCWRFGGRYKWDCGTTKRNISTAHDAFGNYFACTFSEQGVVIAFLNSAVHVFMYTYYMIAALGPKYTKYLWWKKYITWIQLVQFGVMLTYLLTLLVLDCQFPKVLTFFFVGNVVIFLYLFARFYRKAYLKKSS